MRLKNHPLRFMTFVGSENALAVCRVAIGPVGLSELTISGSLMMNFLTSYSAVARLHAQDFMRQTGYPMGRRGCVADHIVPLECGGGDVPSNMQWQTVQEAKI